MLLEPRPNGLDEPRRSRTWLWPVLTVLVFGGFGAIIWSAVSQGPAQKAIPTLTAVGGPIKEKPDDPGGMNVPHRDKTVYEILEPHSETSETEVLLPPPETPEPLRNYAQPNGPATLDGPGPAVSTTEPAQIPEPADNSEFGPEDVSAFAEAVTESAEVVAEDASAGETSGEDDLFDFLETSDAESTTIAGAEDKETFPQIQLGSFRSESAAQVAWNRLKEQAPSLINPLSPIISQADLGSERGIYHRLRAGPFEDADTAIALCNALKAQSLDCLVVSR